MAAAFIESERVFLVSQSPGSGITLLNLTLQETSWSWSDDTRDLTASSKSFGFDAPFATTTKASTGEPVSYLKSGQIYPWVGIFSNQRADQGRNPSDNLVGASYDGSSFVSSMYLTDTRP